MVAGAITILWIMNIIEIWRSIFFNAFLYSESLVMILYFELAIHYSQMVALKRITNLIMNQAI